MTPTTVIEIGRQAVEVTLLISAPLFIAALVTGLLISIFQAATQINEATLSFVPKLIVVFTTLDRRRAVDDHGIDQLRAAALRIHSEYYRMISFTSAQLDAWLTAFIFPAGAHLRPAGQRPHLQQYRPAATYPSDGWTGHHDRQCRYHRQRLRYLPVPGSALRSSTSSAHCSVSPCASPSRR